MILRDEDGCNILKVRRYKGRVKRCKKKEVWIMDKVFTVLVTKPGRRFPQFEMFRGKDYKEILSGLHLPSWNYKFNGYIRELKW